MALFTVLPEVPTELLVPMVPPFSVNVPVPKAEFVTTPLAAEPLEVNCTSPLFKVKPPE